MRTIKVTTNNKIQFVDVDFDDYRNIRRAVGGRFQRVATERMRQFFGSGMIFLIDDDGLFKKLPINPLGCFMYGTAFHCSPIVGDLILVKEVGVTWTAPDDVEELARKLTTVFNLEVDEEEGREENG